MYSAVILYNKEIDLVRSKEHFPVKAWPSKNQKKKYGRKSMPCYYLVLFQFPYLNSLFPFVHSHILPSNKSMFLFQPPESKHLYIPATCFPTENWLQLLMMLCYTLECPNRLISLPISKFFNLSNVPICPQLLFIMPAYLLTESPSKITY